MTVRVLIADDQQLIRTGFRMILAAEPDIEVIGEAATGTEAVAVTRVNSTPHGANLKVTNLINMARHARHDCLVLSDSDIGVGPRYLAEVTAALIGSEVGAATCLYHGVAAAGFWSRLSALAINAHFLPNVLAGLRTGLAEPCFGSTIALTRSRLAEIGGFEAFADRLADDYAIGDAVRARGLQIATPDMLIAHSCSESSFFELWRHELRWARTIRSVDPWGYAGSVVTHPLAWSLLAMAAGSLGPGALAAALAFSAGLRFCGP